MEKSELRENVVIKDPKISSNAFIAEGAQVIGDVVMKDYMFQLLQVINKVMVFI